MTISAQQGRVEEAKCDLLVTAFFEEGKTFTGGLAASDTAMDGYLATVLKEEGFEGKPGQSVMVHTHKRLPAKRVLVLGVGKKNELTAESLRRMAGSAVQSAKAVQAKTLALSLDGLTKGSLDRATAAQAMTEGFLLGDYHFLKYKGEDRKKKEKNAITEVTIVDKDARAVRSLEKSIALGQLFSEATVLVRDLVNEPAVHMKPRTLADAAEELAKIPGVTVKVRGEAEMRKLKMGSFLSVADGSEEEPFLIHLKYKPKKKNAKKVVLCGKGITFDSGGLSLKPSEYMMDMKHDMAGAAVVLGVFSKIAELAPSVEVHGMIGATENMPSGKATRPGDVVTAYNGTTIEVANTDAEGRLVLADVMSWAEKTIKPDYMFDFATLTGAAMYSLGQEVAALMSSDKKLAQQYLKASEVMGEPTWELPLIDEYRQLIQSQIADVRNIASVRWAGAITAGLFLQTFVKETPWVHLDIAGPAWVEKQMLPYSPFGGSGFGVRTTLQFLKNLK